VEGKYNKVVNHYIEKHYDDIVDNKFSRRFDFIYIPKVMRDISEARLTTKEDIIYYLFPHLEGRIDDLERQFENDYYTTAHNAARFFSRMKYEGNIVPGFIRLFEETDDEYVFEYFQLRTTSRREVKAQIDWYINRLSEIRISIPSEKSWLSRLEKAKSHMSPSLFSEDDFEEPMIRFSKEKISIAPPPHEAETIHKIKKAIQELKDMGYYEVLCAEIGHLFEDSINYSGTRISRVCIDSTYRIFLPDYHNMEIKMSTLPKTLFILFLRHPEGIILKHISKYQEELFRIYSIISNREDLAAMKDSIIRVCNPLDSSLNEKLSRIREAFLRSMADGYARQYYVTGTRGESMRIMLDRELVLLPGELK
jgi:hypothetical protein